MTGIDLGIISQLYVKFPLLKDLFVTAVKRPPALPGKLPDDLATLKDTILASYSNVKLSGTFEEDAFTRANIQAHWALWRQHYLLDHMYQKKAHSKEYDDSLEMLYSALDLPGEWHELQRLELFVESTTPLYEKGSPGAPDAGFMGELKAATARIEAIEGMLLDRVKPAVLDADPSEIKERKERMEGPGKSWCKWKETDVEVVRPRWVYQECVPGPAADRAVWLRDYLQRQNPGKPPAEAVR